MQELCKHILLPLLFAKQHKIKDFKILKTRRKKITFFSVFSDAVCHTIFELLAHDGSCWRGDIVCGVLLGICRCDDGHQVVSVRWVNLQNGTGTNISYTAGNKSTSAHSTHQTYWVGQKLHPHTERHYKTKSTHPTGYMKIHSAAHIFPLISIFFKWRKEGQSSNIMN